MKSLKKISALLLASALFILPSCKMDPDILQNVTTEPADTTGAVLPAATTLSQENSTQASDESSLTAENNSDETPSKAPTETPSNAPSETPTEPQSSAPAQDYATYTKQQVLELYAAALNKTRAYKGNITVHHKESFNFEVLEATPGGSLTTQLINYVVGLVVKPTEADYSFTDGSAQNEDGETVPLLLPQKRDFSLPAAGAASAAARSENGMAHVIIKLVPEKVSLGETPAYNSSAVGYLDTSDMSFKVIKINSCEIDYSGSVIDAYIRPDGYIDSVTYTINMTTTGNVTGLGITGGGVIEGAQTETWDLGW